jgi:hypothetical protein
MSIDRIKLPDGREVELTEWLHWPQFSTAEGQGGIGSAADALGLGNGAAINLRLFTYVVGQQIPQAGTPASGKRQATESDTNQVARARMNQDEAYLAFSMTYEVFALGDDTDIPGLVNNVQALEPVLTGTNLRRLQRDCMLELYVGARIQKPQARAPLSYYGQGVGAVAWGSGDQLNTGADVVNQSYGTAGYISPLNQRRWNLPIYVHSDRVMYAKLHSPVGQISGLSQDWRFRLYMDGLKRRPVA